METFLLGLALLFTAGLIQIFRSRRLSLQLVWIGSSDEEVVESGCLVAEVSEDWTSSSQLGKQREVLFRAPD